MSDFVNYRAVNMTISSLENVDLHGFTLDPAYGEVAGALKTSN